MASHHLLPHDTHVYIPAGRLIFGRAGFLPAELHQLTLAHALFFQIDPVGETSTFTIFYLLFTIGLKLINSPFFILNSKFLILLHIVRNKNMIVGYIFEKSP